MSTVTAPGPVATSRYVRKPPPLTRQYILGMVMDGLVRPAVWSLELLGLAPRVLGGVYPRQVKFTEADNPFKYYVPGAQDVFVATYAISGTNWMMQIAHQLIHHGQGEFDHIHSV